MEELTLRVWAAEMLCEQLAHRVNDFTQTLIPVHEDIAFALPDEVLTRHQPAPRLRPTWLVTRQALARWVVGDPPVAPLKRD